MAFGALGLVFLVVVVLHGLPFFRGYTSSELVAPIKYRMGSHVPSPRMYEHDVLSFKSRTLVIEAAQFLSVRLGIPVTGYDSALFVIVALLVAATVALVLRAEGAGVLVAALAALWFVLLNPLDDFVYGYSYKVGNGASLGVYAFGLMTALIFAFYYRRSVVHSLLLIALYVIHPLNAILYLGVILAVVAVRLVRPGNPARLQLIRSQVVNGLFLAVFVALSARHAALASEPTDKLLTLISLVNSKGDAGGYFLPWLNTQRFMNFLVLAVCLPPFLFLSGRRGLLGTRLAAFLLTVTAIVLAVAGLHYVAYRFSLAQVVAADPSRLTALLQPIAFVAVMVAVVQRVRKERAVGVAATALLIALLMQMTSNVLILFPLLVLFVLFAREVHVPAALVLGALALVAAYLIRIDPAAGVMGSLEAGTQRAKLAALVALVAGLFGLWRSRSYRLLWISAVVVAVGLLAGTRAAADLAHYRDGRVQELAYRDLDEFLDANVSATAVFMTLDEPFAFTALRPVLVAFHNTGYGIYAGNLEKLERELAAVWGISLSESYRQEVERAGFHLRRGLNGVMEESMRELDADRITSIRRDYAEFEYILVPRGFEFADDSLPLALVYRGKNHEVFRITGS